MKLKDLLKKLFPDKTAEIDQLEDETKQQSKSDDNDSKQKVDDALLKKLYEEIKAENKKLLDELAKVKEKEEAREKILAQKAEAEVKAKIEDALKKAIEEKRIPAKDDKTIASIKALLEKDFDNGVVVLNAMPKISDEKPTQTPVTNENKNVGGILGKILERNQITQN
ncbi:MAG: hypothetical protein NZM09_12075 [Ignavibacterium sp.]|nr:hypothetical protein [Ignavibacterium sp.]MDW8376412.1 hypothetical protein [Ignavibacteriales bacterium]